MFRKWANILPFGIVKWIVKKFSHEFVTLKIGQTEIKGSFWQMGTDEGYFISSLAAMKAEAARQRAKLDRYVDKIKKIEEGTEQ